MTDKRDIQAVIEQIEANPEMAQKLDGLSLPDRIMVARALINCGEWPVQEATPEYEVGFPRFVTWQVGGIY